MSEARKVAYSDQVPTGSPEGTRSPREAYVDALKAERDSIAAQPDDRPNRSRRLADIDAELREFGAKADSDKGEDKADDKAKGQAETADSGPAGNTGRGRRA